MSELLVVRIGQSTRLNRALAFATEGLQAEQTDCLNPAAWGGKRLLFAAAADAYGIDPAFPALLREIRSHPGCLQGCIAGVVIDSTDELYTKDAAQSLVLAANLAGCLFPGKPLVEGTGSLFNQHILAKQLGLGLEETYFSRIRELVMRIVEFEPIHFDAPEIVMLHASDNTRSNTVWIGREVAARLPDNCRVTELSLQNGTIYDCRGCSFEACLHFAENGRCFYGGAMATDILPAIRRCNALFMLCPNYNDSVSANIMAMFNRLTNLLVTRDLSDKYLFGVVVSGYSGSDLVARQLLGALCLNKTMMLPPEFCIMQTAHEPGTAKEAEGISARLDAFAENMTNILIGDRKSEAP